MVPNFGQRIRGDDETTSKAHRKRTNRAGGDNANVERTKESEETKKYMKESEKKRILNREVDHLLESELGIDLRSDGVKRITSPDELRKTLDRINGPSNA